jgi:hypothetical protein
MMKPIVFGLVLLLGGCAGLQSSDPASPYYGFPPGWSVQLNRVLPVDPGAATVRLQYGRIVPRNGVQEQDPFCIMEVNTLSNQVQLLQPGRFEVMQVTRSVSSIMAAAASPLIKARFAFDDGSPSFLYFITEFRLHNADQPDVRSLRCTWNQMAPGNQGLMRYLTLDEMRGALGDWISLIPPAERL